MAHAQYIIDGKGKKVSVVLPVKDYETMLDKIEELEDIQMYDEVKARNEKSILLEDYVKQRSKKHG